jgi:hypothetical protein
VSTVSKILSGGFICWLRWRDSEVQRAKLKTTLFRQWEAAKDKAV